MSAATITELEVRELVITDEPGHPGGTPLRVLVPIPEALERRMAALEILEVRETPDGIERLGRARYFERHHPAIPGGFDYIATCTTLAYRLSHRHPWIDAKAISVIHVRAERWQAWREIPLAEVLT